MRILTAVLSAFFFLFSGCGPVSEHRPVEILLADEFTAGEPEYSGMAWAGQNLVLLPQFPDRFPGDEGGNLLSVPKKRIEDYLDGNNTNPIVPRKITFDDGGVLEAVPGFEGFEYCFRKRGLGAGKSKPDQLVAKADSVRSFHVSNVI